MPQQSKYHGVWEHIKVHGKATLLVERAYHARVAKAVRKRKDLDIGYKIVLGERGKRATLKSWSDSQVANKLHFSLEYNLTEEDF